MGGINVKKGMFNKFDYKEITSHIKDTILYEIIPNETIINRKIKDK
ncbi:MAG: hypothetical protein IKP65_05390 [Alphaproteobacteria bacterium]|nr:hypothetical protein [Alphaproteobacteria bacterium]